MHLHVGLETLGLETLSRGPVLSLFFPWRGGAGQRETRSARREKEPGEAPGWSWWVGGGARCGGGYAIVWASCAQRRLHILDHASPKKDSIKTASRPPSAGLANQLSVGQSVEKERLGVEKQWVRVHVVLKERIPAIVRELRGLAEQLNVNFHRRNDDRAPFWDLPTLQREGATCPVVGEGGQGVRPRRRRSGVSIVLDRGQRTGL